MMVALLCRGHLLVEGVPGLAKTLAVKTLVPGAGRCTSRASSSRRTCCRPTSSARMIYQPQDGRVRRRARARCSRTCVLGRRDQPRARRRCSRALLEAMQERQVTIGDEHRTRCPIRSWCSRRRTRSSRRARTRCPRRRWTGSSLKVKVDYPRKRGGAPDPRPHDLGRGARGRARARARRHPISLVRARARGLPGRAHPRLHRRDRDRDPPAAGRRPAGRRAPDRSFGASPRGDARVLRGGRAPVAFLHGRGYVVPEDVKDIAHDVLRHRILLTYEAEAENVTTETIVRRVLERVEVP